MSSLVLSGDVSGTVTVSVPNVAGSNTATLPAATGTIMVSGNMPAFSAYQSSSQTISATTFTKIQFQTEEFDTNLNFNNTGSTVGSTPAYAFLPTVAGYYQVNGSIFYNTAATCQVFIYKNGTVFKRGNQANTTNVEPIVSALVYLNGTTDYIELYGYHVSGSTIAAQLDTTYFQACMARGA